jgi:hypothetical protein
MAPAIPAPAPSQPTAKQTKTYTVTISNGNQVTQTTFELGDDGSWLPSEGRGTGAVTRPAQAIPQPAAMPFDPVAFRQMVLQNQELVRQQILQTRQRMLQRIGR